jgi:signal transduction histidine kinase
VKFRLVGWCATFVLIAALVFGGLAWVTVAALRVEAAQRDAAARAERANRERLALWRLDGYLLPALGLENNRPFAHYTTLHAPYPAVEAGPGPLAVGSFRLPSPLLSAELPAWMALHFQLDPEHGWNSPQVIPPELADRLHGLPFNLILSNVTPQRTQLLAELREKLPADAVLRTLAERERASPDDNPFVVPVPLLDETATPKPPGLSPGDPAPGQSRPGPVRASIARERRSGPMRGAAGRPFRYSINGPAEAPRSAASSAPLNLNQLSQLPAPAPAPTATKAAPTAKQAGEYGARLNAMQRSLENRGAYANNQQLSAVPNALAPTNSMAAGGGLGTAQVPQLMMKKAAPAPPSEKEQRHLQEQLGRDANALAAGRSRFGLGLAEAAGGRKAAPTAQPMAVHLGPIRPRWLTASDGSEVLLLVRAARLEHEVVYQGVLLDWPRLRDGLREQVADLFPAATLTPVRDPDPITPERAMTALPVQLDPGPAPDLPPAGWTPLRFGLLLAWAAALIALLAVGIGGRALVGLSERRIRFVSAVTHELRTPLTSLRLYLDLLSSGMIADEAKQREYLNTLVTESDRLNRLIENVLDFARLEKRTIQAVMAPTVIAELLEQVRQTWTDRCAADGKELVVISTLPAEQTVTTDPRMTAQVLGNLIDNARKYSREADDHRIWVWAKPGERGQLVLEVEDRGPGVSASERGSVFRPFRRGHAADTLAGGAGLGLALAKHWADLLGGTLSYRPADGGIGACFRLELPANK